MGLERALIADAETNGTLLRVSFNPDEYSIDKTNNFAESAIPGLSAPILQFVNGAAQTLELELFLDAREAGIGDVRELTGKLLGLMDIDPDLHAPRPVVFVWGSLSFVGVLTKASQKYIMFTPNGIPARARVQVTFKEYKNVELEAKEIKRQTADYSRLHVVSEGETLPVLAQRYYQNSLQWRPIALHNAIDDPREVAVGTRLVVPQLPYRNPETGEVEL
jgi:nucleoid-associated protein YgaU